jgi:FMN-dependent NADH-azoreductase
MVYILNQWRKAMSYTILHIDSSPLGERSVSRKLTAKILRELQDTHPHSRIVTRDLGISPMPHLNGLTLGSFFTPPEQRNEALHEAVKLSDQAIDEVLAADIIVIGAPMWNFGIPSALKAWIDHIVRAGRTFKYGAAGPESLLPKGKKVIIVSSRGGIYSAGPMKLMDYQETYLTAVFGFIGLSDVSFVRAEGIAMGPEAAAAALKAAEAQVGAVLGKAA